MTLHAMVVSPEKVIYEGDTSEILVPTTMGDITVLPEHIPLLATIRPGEVILKNGNKKEYFAVSGGYLEVNRKEVTLLAEYAIESEKIDAIKAEEAKKRAEKAMQEKLSDEDFASVSADLRRSIAELQAVRRRRGNRTQPV